MKEKSFDPNHKHTETLKPYAQKLRREMTPEEKRLWYDFLKMIPVTVKRQEPFGKYIVDFYVPSYRTVIEVDGKQHTEGKVFEKDLERDAFLSSLDIRVLRVYNEDVRKDFSGTCRMIDAFFQAVTGEKGLRNPPGE